MKAISDQLKRVKRLLTKQQKQDRKKWRAMKERQAHQMSYEDYSWMEYYR